MSPGVQPLGEASGVSAMRVKYVCALFALSAWIAKFVN